MGTNWWDARVATKASLITSPYACAIDPPMMVLLVFDALQDHGVCQPTDIYCQQNPLFLCMTCKIVTVWG